MAIDVQSTPLFLELMKLAKGEIFAEEDPDIYSKRYKAFVDLENVGRKVLEDPANTPGALRFQPVGETEWSNLYIIRSKYGWNLVYWYSESQGGPVGGQTGQFRPILVFDDSGQPVKRILDGIQKLLPGNTSLPSEAAEQLSKLFNSAEPIEELFRAIKSSK